MNPVILVYDAAMSTGKTRPGQTRLWCRTCGDQYGSSAELVQHVMEERRKMTDATEGVCPCCGRENGHADNCPYK